MPRRIIAGLLLAGCVASVAHAEDAWRDLTGRLAPDLVFAEAAQGLEPGTSLSSFRGRQVVLLVFWLRDCPHCRRELEKVQRLQEVYSQSGLTIVSVASHKYPLSQVLPVMAQRKWTFPVARDTDGSLAVRYGNGRRPGYYVIGIDGRVKALSPSQRVIEAELGRWRLHELGPVPDALEDAREHVYAGDYGAALRAAEDVARQADASAEVRAAVARLASLAGRKIQNRVDRAEAWHASGETENAEQEYRGIVATFEGTSLESRARALLEEYLTRRTRPGR